MALPFGSGHTIVASSIESLKPDADVSLFVRSSGVTLAEPAHDEGVRGMIRDVAFNGRGYDHVIDVGEGFSLTKIFATTRFERGRNVKICFDPSACFVMDPTREVSE